MPAFLDRYAAAFGRPQAMLLRFAGLTGAEVRADGAWVTDASGRRWLDLGSFGIHLLGHRHPATLAAARDQLGRMGLGTKILGSAAATACAEALLEHAPAGLDRVLFANSGGEAVDAAVRLAMLATGRSELAALRRGYHGRTASALALSDPPEHASPVPLAHRVTRLSPADLDRAREVLQTRRVAALVAEPVQGEGGVRPVDPAALAALRALCAETGTLFVLDEIQSGLGRCGRLWRSAADVPPDVLLTGKTLGGGLVPVAAALYASRCAGAKATDPLLLASSYAGGALAGRVGETVVRTVADEALLARVRESGARARARLSAALAGEARVVEVRGEGLMIGVELDAAHVAGDVVLEAARRGVLVTFCLNDPRVVRVYPPVVCDGADLDAGLDAIAEAVAAAAASAADDLAVELASRG